MTAELYRGLADLPAFNPDQDGDLVPEPVGLNEVWLAIVRHLKPE